MAFSDVLRCAAVLLVSACSGRGGASDSTDTEATGESGSSGSSGSVTAGLCPVGSEGCMCTGGGSCDGTLVCDGGMCVPPGMSSVTNADTTSASTSATGLDTGDSGVGDGSSTGAPVDLDEWTKRRPVVLANPNDVDMVDHQVMIDIDLGDATAAALDGVRFTDEDSELLPHWLEGFVAGVGARVWVRVPLVPAEDETTIYMWYGNPAPTDGAAPAEVFDLWEDFDEDLSAADWSWTDGYVVDNGRLTITTGSVYSNSPMVTLPGLQIEILARWPADTGSGSGLTAAEFQGAVGDQDLLSIESSPLHYTAVDGPMTLVNANWSNPPGAAGDQFEWHGVAAGGGVARFSRTHDYDPAYVWWQQVEADIPNDYYLWLGHAWGSLAGSDPTQDIEIDILLARKFADIPAETTVGDEEDV
jgi:hypothetical protein